MLPCDAQVLAPFSEVVPHVFSSLIVTKLLDLCAELPLTLGDKVLEGLECVTLVFQEGDLLVP